MDVALEKPGNGYRRCKAAHGSVRRISQVKGRSGTCGPCVRHFRVLFFGAAGGPFLLFFLRRNYHAASHAASTGHPSAHGADRQRLSLGLHPGGPAHRGGPLVLHQDPLCSDPLLRRGYAPGLWQHLPVRRKAAERNELLPGSGYRHCRSGGHRQHRGRLGSHPDRRPGGHFLDVDHRLFRHGYHLLRGRAGPGDPGEGQGRQHPGRSRLLHHHRVPGLLRQIPGGLFLRSHYPGPGLLRLYGAVQLHQLHL